MRLTLQRHELKEAVAGLGRIVGRKNTLPILGGVKFDVGTDTVAQVTDLDQRASFRFKDAVATGTGSFIAGFDQVKELAKGPDIDSIEFVLTGKDKLTVGNPIAGQVVTRDFTTLDPEEWPELPSDVKVKPVNGFLEAFQRVSAFASTDSTRYVLNGCYLDVSDKGQNKARIIATDGRRLTMANTMTLPISDSCIVPTTKFLAWSQLKGDVLVGTAKKGSSVWFGLEVGPWSYVLKTVDGTYPNYRQVIPADVGDNTIVFTDQDCASLKSILRAFPGDASGSIALRPGANGAVTICGKGKDDARETTVVLAQGSTYTGKAPAIGVNRDFLMDAIDAGFRKFSFTDEMSPLVAKDSSATHVLMPMRVADMPARPPEPAQEPVEDKQQAPVTPEPETATESVKEPEQKPVEEKKGRRQMSKKPETAIEKLQEAFEGAKAKLREANVALVELSGLIKEAAREDKQQRQEVENVRTVLGKVQSLKV